MIVMKKFLFWLLTNEKEILNCRKDLKLIIWGKKLNLILNKGGIYKDD